MRAVKFWFYTYVVLTISMILMISVGNNVVSELFVLIFGLAAGATFGATFQEYFDKKGNENGAA